ncbi:MAG: 3-dehydroquinate synthase-like [Trebouxia sp. A1-2]|nr:MAG: 3-dehydroquinate synthase-like [Trebouxia sp. A1-2]
MAVLTSAVESGMSTFLFPAQHQHLAQEWKGVVDFDALLCDGDAIHADNQQVGRIKRVSSAADMQAAAKDCDQRGFFVMDCSDWQIIPAENLVAAFQGKAAALLGMATSASGARVMLEALEAGTAGVVLKTDDPLQVRELAAYLKTLNAKQNKLALEVATVTSVQKVGMGDRVCVDLCSLLAPGEGMLIGNFARAAFLVHSECTESRYINSRPFRVNAGPVHSYTACPNDQTAYLAELKSGKEVLVVNAEGQQRSAIVGRVKIETRPLVLVEAETQDGQRHSILLQNAETVRLIGPRMTMSSVSNMVDESGLSQKPKHSDVSSSQQSESDAVSVSELQVGQPVYLHLQGAARHTGISIQENIVER